MSDLPYRPCAGVMLANRDGHVFVGQRIDTAADAWQMPQGGIDRGEAPLDAALRELEEETGIARTKVTLMAEAPEWLCYDFPPEIATRVAGGRYRGQRQRWFLFRFLGTDDDVRLETEHPEFRAWRWTEAEALADLAVPFKRALYDGVVAAFRPMLVPA